MSGGTVSTMSGGSIGLGTVSTVRGAVALSCTTKAVSLGTSEVTLETVGFGTTEATLETVCKSFNSAAQALSSCTAEAIA